MLGYLFLFYGRMGRLQYFLWAWIFVPVIIFLVALVLCFILAFGSHTSDPWTTILVFVGPVLLLFAWVEFSLQATRIRDIGWNPGIIIPVVLGINLIDLGVAHFVPALADSTGLHTVVSSIIGILYTLVLLFMPTDGSEMVPTIFSGLSAPKVNVGRSRTKPSEPLVNRVVRQQPFEEHRYPREKVPFGRRGLT